MTKQSKNGDSVTPKKKDAKPMLTLDGSDTFAASGVLGYANALKVQADMLAKADPNKAKLLDLNKKMIAHANAIKEYQGKNGSELPI